MSIEEKKKKIGSKENTKTNYRDSLIRRTLLTITLCLIVLIICNISKKAESVLNKYIFETNYNFAKINSIYKKYLLNVTNKKGDSKPVSKTENLEYYKIEDYNGGALLTVDGNYNVHMLESGLVVFVGEKEPYGSTIIVQQSNGIDVIYGNVKTDEIKIYDYVEKGKIIGTADKKLYLTFQKEGSVLDYKTYIK